MSVVDLQGEHGVQRSPERRHRRGVPLRHPDRECVDQEIHRSRRVRAGRRGPRGLRRLQQAAGPAHIAAPSALRWVVARQPGVEGIEAPGRADEQPRGLADAALVERDLTPQLLDLRRLQRVDRAGLDGDEQLQRRVERAGVALGPRRGEQAPRAASRAPG